MSSPRTHRGASPWTRTLFKLDYRVWFLLAAWVILGYIPFVNVRKQKQQDLRTWMMEFSELQNTGLHVYFRSCLWLQAPKPKKKKNQGTSQEMIRLRVPKLKCHGSRDPGKPPPPPPLRPGKIRNRRVQVKTKKKPGSTPQKKKPFHEGWQKILAESNKGSWFDHSSLLKNDQRNDLKCKSTICL